MFGTYSECTDKKCLTVNANGTVRKTNLFIKSVVMSLSNENKIEIALLLFFENSNLNYNSTRNSSRILYLFNLRQPF